MLRLSGVLRQSERRTRHHFTLDGQTNPREWFNWHPKEFMPQRYDRHLFLYEQHQWAHKHHLLCHQVFLKDILQHAQYPEPDAWIIDCRTEPERMHRWVPHSHWLPRDEVDYALQLGDAEFSDMYGFTKPRHSEDVILISHDGLASEQAGWEFRKAFYHHVYNYRAGTNELFGEGYADFAGDVQTLKPWKGPFPQSGIYTDVWSKRKVLTRTGPFDKQYEMQDFALPDLELEKPRHLDDDPRSHMPHGLQ
jgi:hypothetical protein